MNAEFDISTLHWSRDWKSLCINVDDVIILLNFARWDTVKDFQDQIKGPIQQTHGSNFIHMNSPVNFNVLMSKAAHMYKCL